MIPDPVKGILLGIIQGLTEFLPISSSGHLVVFQNIFGLREPEMLFDSALHLGTLLAVFVYFRSDLKQMVMETLQYIIDCSQSRRKLTEIHKVPYASLTLWVLIGTIPTALIGVLFRSSIEKLFGSVSWVGVMLVFTGLILAATRMIPKDYTQRTRIGLLAALAVGTAQGLALIPGISRSGATIVCGMLFMIERNWAARYSFLLSIPAIMGAIVLQLDGAVRENMDLLSTVYGLIAAALVGLLALKILMGMVKKGKLYYFAPYCWALGLFIIAFQLS
jgi:undecaprenyl-diphosphatase